MLLKLSSLGILTEYCEAAASGYEASICVCRDLLSGTATASRDL